ncbi:MAG: phosphohydrolase [Lachnospiraceae bacterium]|nr:phosphohydrolase [Lachnospiraceae bacterium]
MLSNKEHLLFLDHINDLLGSPQVLSMGNFIQHGNVTTLEHALCVAWFTFLICRFLKRESREAVRGALLHDLYLYDWHAKVTKNSAHRRFHGFTHPGAALKNANRFFTLSVKEQDIIKKHMWPLTVIPPRYLDSYIVCLADKVCATKETFHRYKDVYACRELLKTVAGH